MDSAENKKLMQDVFAEFAKANSRPFVEAMADDFRWTISGTGRWSRTYDGKHAVFGEVTKGQDVVNAIAQGDKIESIEILDSTDDLFTAQKAQIDKWNAALK